jgi:hypothetical protein
VTCTTTNDRILRIRELRSILDEVSTIGGSLRFRLSDAQMEAVKQNLRAEIDDLTSLVGIMVDDSCEGAG